MIMRETAEDVVFNAIERAARFGKTCPTNSQIAALLGRQSPSSAVKILSRLSKAGKIIVHSGQCSRVVDIPSLGIGTAGLLPQAHWRETRGQELATHKRGALPDEVERTATPRKRQVGPSMEAATVLTVSRDPCPNCGVRGDIGCKHRRLA